LNAVTENPLSASAGPRLAGWHVLAAVLAFFAAVLAVNAVMIYAALSTYSGVTAAEPYRKGLHYNARILAAERQAQLDWKEVLNIEPDGHVVLSLRGADGRPISNLEVELSIGRPSTNRQDRHLRLLAQDAGGYSAQIAPLPPGAWIVGIEARETAADDEPIFRARRRLWMAP
jgi:nitrogen fixation protein FixH